MYGCVTCGLNICVSECTSSSSLQKASSFNIIKAFYSMIQLLLQADVTESDVT